MRIYILTHLAELDGSGRLKVLGAYAQKAEAEAALELLKAPDVRGDVGIEEHKVQSLPTATYGALQSSPMALAEAEKRRRLAMDQYQGATNLGQQIGFNMASGTMLNGECRAVRHLN